MQKTGFSYHYSKEKLEEFQQLSYEQRLEWVEQMNRFLQKFMPPKSKLRWEKLRQGKN